MKTVGVLALQGDFEAHCKAVRSLGARALEVRTVSELAGCDGLILPGGESSTMLKLLDLEGLTTAVAEFGATKPIYGTCAGVILLAKRVSNPEQCSLGLMDLDVERNAYGRQIDSRVAKIECADGSTIEAVFIRAPIVRRAGPEVRVIASYQGTPVWVEQGLHMATTFHPELSADSPAHRRFIDKLR